MKPTRNAVPAALAALLAIAFATAAFGQPPTRPAARELPFKLLALEIVRFEKPLRVEAGTNGKPLDQALLVRVSVDARAYDALPPDIEPRLYVGTRELRTLELDRPKEGPLRVTFYTRQLEAPNEGAPMVLTIEHGRPAREASRYARRTDLPRFRRAELKDLRPR